MGNEYFRFKRFTIFQDKCAMKVGTDGVLLGAWADTEHATKITDIGTGTGLIAIMLAQRTQNAIISGIEIDHDAFMQAKDNMSNTEWKDRMSVENADVNEFYQSHEAEYDMIVSNPPFYKEDTKGYCEKRNIARHTDGLSFEALTKAASFMLKEKGKFSVILPASAASEFIGEAIKNRLSLTRKTDIRTKAGASPKRVLMEFEKGTNNKATEYSELLLNENGERSKDYTALTSDFYL